MTVGLFTSYFSLLLSALGPGWNRWCEIRLLCITELMHSDGPKCADEARLVFKFQRVFRSRRGHFCGCLLEVWMNPAAEGASVDDLLMAAESSSSSAFI